MTGERLTGLCALLLDIPDSEARQLAHRTSALVSTLPRPARTAFAAGLGAVDALSRASGTGPLSRQALTDRSRLLARIGGAPGRADLLDALKVPVLLAWGAGSVERQQAGSRIRLPPARPDPDLDVTPASTWPARSTADVVVVGSGAGGAMAARTLAASGMDVVVVEEGRRFGVEELRSRPALERFSALYRDAGATVALGRPPVLLPIGRGVGGTTLVNSGTCYRTPDGVLLGWRDDHGLALADPDAFNPFLELVEALLQVAPVPAEIMGHNGRLTLLGAERLGWSAHPLRRNAPGCAGSCECAVGCPQNAKFGVHLNALPEACASGARIVSEARVEVVLHQPGPTGSREHRWVSGVRALRGDGSTLEILAPRVVVAAGATETPTLLRRSGLGGHPGLGRNLAIHPAVSTGGWFPERVDATRGVLQSAGVDQFHASDGILVEATSTPPGMGSMILPGAGPELRRQLERAPYLGTLGAMIGDRPSGRVLGRRRSLVRYSLDAGDGARLVKAIGVMARLHFAAGATSVVTGIRGHETVSTAAELEEALDHARPERLHLAAFHPTGTARMGNDLECHPVDKQGRLRGVEGVWVADASVVPSCPGVNPQVTIMALATAIATGIVGAPPLL